MIRDIVNFDDDTRKRAWMTKLGALTGPWVIELKRWRPKRSNAANAYWHAVVVEALREFFEQQDQHFTHDECHYMLVDDLCPPREVIDMNTGQVVLRVGARSSRMMVDEFSVLVDRAIARLAGFGIVVPDPASLAAPKKKRGRAA